MPELMRKLPSSLTRFALWQKASWTTSRVCCAPAGAAITQAACHKNYNPSRPDVLHNIEKPLLVRTQRQIFIACVDIDRFTGVEMEDGLRG
jgi:hypothetical protein